jgi:hypothetical protein
MNLANTHAPPPAHQKNQLDARELLLGCADVGRGGGDAPIDVPGGGAGVCVCTGTTHKHKSSVKRRTATHYFELVVMYW